MRVTYYQGWYYANKKLVKSEMKNYYPLPFYNITTEIYAIKHCFI